MYTKHGKLGIIQPRRKMFHARGLENFWGSPMACFRGKFLKLGVSEMLFPTLWSGNLPYSKGYKTPYKYSFKTPPL